MKKIRLGSSDLQVSDISLGCMRINKLSAKEANHMIHHAMELGINFFDHADIYARGRAEEIFANAIGMNDDVREKMFLQTKTGIRKGYYDFSKEHILDSVDGSLNRLKTDYIDVLLLHRPDALMEPEEVGEAFSQLKESGKVLHFGVSNHHPLQVELLKKHVKEDLLVNQLQLSIMHTGMIDAGIQVNTRHENAANRDGGVLEYSRLNEMTIQAWSPFQHGALKEVFIDNEKFPNLNEKLQEIADKHHVTKSAIATAWILRHPAKIQAVVGTMNADRLTHIAKASDVELSREEWYEVYRAAGNEVP